jgi:hypothetical protein
LIPRIASLSERIELALPLKKSAGNIVEKQVIVEIK